MEENLIKLLLQELEIQVELVDVNRSIFEYLIDSFHWVKFMINIEIEFDIELEVSDLNVELVTLRELEQIVNKKRTN